MADRVLRGSRLGTTSYETDRNTDLAPRREVVLRLPERARDPDADGARRRAAGQLGVPHLRRHRAAARRRRSGGPHRQADRTHWDMLLERRSLDDLEDVLNERLAELRPAPRKSA